MRKLILLSAATSAIEAHVPALIAASARARENAVVLNFDATAHPVAPDGVLGIILAGSYDSVKRMVLDECTKATKSKRPVLLLVEDQGAAVAELKGAYVIRFNRERPADMLRHISTCLETNKGDAWVVMTGMAILFCYLLTTE